MRMTAMQTLCVIIRKSKEGVIYLYLKFLLKYADRFRKTIYEYQGITIESTRALCTASVFIRLFGD